MAIKWIKATTGIRYYEHQERKHGIKFDKCYAIYYTINYKTTFETIGWSSEGIKQETCAAILEKLRQNHKSGLGPQTYKEMREETINAREKEKEIERKDKELTLRYIFEEEYLKYQKIKGKKEDTIKSEIGFFNHYIYPFFQETPISKIDIKSINNFLLYLSKITGVGSKKKLSDSTKRSILALISQIFTYTETNLSDLLIGKIENPISKAKKPRTDNVRVRFLQREEAKALLEELKKRSEPTYQLSLISLFTGMRAGEILKLHWQDIDFNEKSIYIKDPKNKVSRHAFMNQDVENLLQEMYKNKDGERLFTGKEVSKTYERTVEYLELNKGVDDVRQRVCFHTLRHTFASWHAKAGTPLYTISKLLGHKTMKMTERYAHLCPSAEKQAVNILNNALLDCN